MITQERQHGGARFVNFQSTGAAPIHPDVATIYTVLTGSEASDCVVDLPESFREGPQAVSVYNLPTSSFNVHVRTENNSIIFLDPGHMAVLSFADGSWIVESDLTVNGASANLNGSPRTITDMNNDGLPTYNPRCGTILLVNCVSTLDRIFTNQWELFFPFIGKIVRLVEDGPCYIVIDPDIENGDDPDSTDPLLPDLEIFESFDECSECIGLFLLRHCQDAYDDIVSDTSSLGTYIGKVVVIDGYEGCWEVSETVVGTPVSVAISDNAEDCSDENVCPLCVDDAFPYAEEDKIEFTFGGTFGPGDQVVLDFTYINEACPDASSGGKPSIDDWLTATFSVTLDYESHTSSQIKFSGTATYTRTQGEDPIAVAGAGTTVVDTISVSATWVESVVVDGSLESETEIGPAWVVGLDLNVLGVKISPPQGPQPNLVCSSDEDYDGIWTYEDPFEPGEFITEASQTSSADPCEGDLDFQVNGISECTQPGPGFPNMNKQVIISIKRIQAND